MDWPPLRCALALLSARQAAPHVPALTPQDALGNVFYDWDLAIPPLQCNAATSQFGNMGSCESESVVFVSSTVQNGYLTLMCASLSTRRQWCAATGPLCPSACSAACHGVP